MNENEQVNKNKGGQGVSGNFAENAGGNVNSDKIVILGRVAFHAHWFKHKTDPDGNPMPVFYQGGGRDSYSEYFIRKQTDLAKQQIQKKKQNKKIEQENAEDTSKDTSKKDQNIEQKGFETKAAELEGEQNHETSGSGDKGESHSESENGPPQPYMWSTAGDLSVRSEHAQKDGKIFDLNASSTTHPGQDHNCRCKAVMLDANGNPTGKVGRFAYDAEEQHNILLVAENEQELQQLSDELAEKNKHLTDKHNDTIQQMQENRESHQLQQENQSHQSHQINQSQSHQTNQGENQQGSQQVSQANHQTSQPHHTNQPHQTNQSNAGGGHNANPQPDFEKAVERSKEIARNNPINGNRECAKKVREALEAGGIVLEQTGYAKNYGPSLEKAGFEPVSTRDNKNNYEPQLGDVAVLQPHSSQKPVDKTGNQAGHMSIYDGKTWYSDFRQNNDWYGGGNAKKENPDYTIYRFEG